MKGTFKPGDKLIIEKVLFGQIKKGDLIIFRRLRENQSDFIVHRVVGITPNGLITRGDNCRNIDSDIVTQENSIGRVSRFDRKEKTREARNGLFGTHWANFLRARNTLIYLCKHILRRPYILAKKSGIIAKLWHPEITIVRLQTPEGLLDKFLRKKRTVAVHWLKMNRWQWKRPYEFIIHP